MSSNFEEDNKLSARVASPPEKLTMRAIISFSLVAAFLFYEMAIQVSPGVMATAMLAELHFSAVWLGFAMSAYYYSYSLMMIPVGLLFDRLSTKRLLIFAVSLCVVGCVMFYYIQGPILLISARFFTGLGSAFAFIGVLVVAARCFPCRYYAPLVGITQLLAALGAMSGVTPVALAVSSFGWRQSMLGFAAIGLILILLLFLVLRGDCVERSAIDYFKAQNNKSSLNSSVHRHSLGQSLAVIFKQTQTLWLALYSFCAWAPVTLFASLWGVPYFIARYSISNTKASFAIDMLWLGIAIAAPILGWAVKRISHRALLFCSALIGGLSSLGIIYLSDISFNLCCVFCFGIGIAAAANILCFDLVNINNPRTEHAVAVGVNNIALVVTGVILQPAVGLLLHRHAAIRLGVLPENFSHYVMSDYMASLWIMPLCCFVAVLAALFLIRYPIRQHN